MRHLSIKPLGSDDHVLVFLSISAYISPFSDPPRLMVQAGCHQVLS